MIDEQSCLTDASTSSGSMVPLWKQARDALIGVVDASFVPIHYGSYETR